MDEEMSEEFIAASAMLILTLVVCLKATRNTRRWWVRPINQERPRRGSFQTFFNTIKNTDSELFFKYTRMTSFQYDTLLALVRPRLLKRSRREPLSPGLRLAMTLKYLAHGGSFQNLGWEFRVGASTVSKVIPETCQAIWDVLQPRYLKEPTKIDWLKIADEFEKKWNFPHCLGAIDGKHIQIQCPYKSGTMFYNYKKFFSIVLLATCDANYCFTWVDIGAYGSDSDGGIFRNTKFGKKLDNNELNIPASKPVTGTNVNLPYYLVGDAAFPLKSYLMRPYPGRFLPDIKKIFNYRLSRARRTIENAFGILSGRWRVFRAPIICSVRTTELIVQAAVCLHNYIMNSENINYFNRNYIDRYSDDGTIIDGEWRQTTANDSNLTPVGRVGSNVAARNVCLNRDQLANYLVSPQGEVGWQYAVINRGR